MTIFDLPVHPAAAIFPMLPDDELNELADDIKANGLQHALIVKDGFLIDGRNRLEGCRRAGIEPRTEELNGADPVTYILSANVNRRHLSKGQRAMAVAMLYPEAGSVGRLSLPFDKMYLSRARTVLRWTPPLADQVLAGTKSLNDAYEEALRLKNQSDTEPNRLDRLRKVAQDLADAVTEEKKSLLEAEAELGRRLMDRRNTFTACRDLFEHLTSTVSIIEGPQRQQMIDALTDPESPLPKDKALALIDAWIEGFTALKEGIR